jgi:vancomycin resistance protein VanW
MLNKKYVYDLAVFKNQFFRHIKNHTDRRRYSKLKSETKLPFKVTSHKSLLIRRLGNSDIRLQKNKVINLSKAIPKINGIIIRPKETFSFWKLVGLPSSKVGYVDGMLLWNGEVRVGIGGGLCQLSNLIYWLALHSPLEVVERFRHQFDAFPDSGRVLPFGTGATIFYNYIDLKFYNSTDHTLQFNVWLTKSHLNGEILSDQEVIKSYKIEERDHCFLYDDKSKKYFRTNKIYQKVFNKITGEKIKENLIYSNFCEMKYPPREGAVVLALNEFKV